MFCLLRLAEEEELSLVNTFFQTPKGGVSATNHGPKGKNDQWGLDYIVTRLPHRHLVQTVKVHPVVRIESDYHIVSASVLLLGRFTPNRPVYPKKRIPPLDRRRIVNNSTLRDQLKESICAALRGLWVRGG